MDLVTFAQPSETAARLLARTFVDPVPTGISFMGTLRPGQLLELVGPSSSGKTELLVQIAATTILAKHWEANVVMLDLDGKFHIGRLIEALHGKLKAALSQLQGIGPETEEDIIMACLQRFHLIRCCSSYEFLATLKTMRPFLHQLRVGQGLRLLLIDNVGAFYWLDKAVRGVPNPGPHAPPGARAAPLTFHRANAAAAAEVLSLMRHFRLAVVATKAAFLAAQLHDGEEEVWANREYLPKAWTDCVMRRILLRCIKGDAMRFAAKWELPMRPLVQYFTTAAGGIVQP